MTSGPERKGANFCEYRRASGEPGDGSPQGGGSPRLGFWTWDRSREQPRRTPLRLAMHTHHWELWQRLHAPSTAERPPGAAPASHGGGQVEGPQAGRGPSGRRLDLWGEEEGPFLFVWLWWQQQEDKRSWYMMHLVRGAIPMSRLSATALGRAAFVPTSIQQSCRQPVPPPSLLWSPRRNI